MPKRKVSRASISRYYSRKAKQVEEEEGKAEVSASSEEPIVESLEQQLRMFFASVDSGNGEEETRQRAKGEGKSSTNLLGSLERQLRALYDTTR